MQVNLYTTLGIICYISFTLADEDDLSNRQTVLSDREMAGFKKEYEEYKAEKKAGDPADLFATNQHRSYPDVYKDLGRRFVLQYPYKLENNLNEDKEAVANLDMAIMVKTQKRKLDNNRLKPVKAPPELVLAVARESALLEASKQINPSEKLIEQDILRSGNYWNDVWKEEVDPNTLRTRDDDDIQSVKVQIMPGTKLYQLVSVLRKISPKLIYVINKD